MDRRRFLAAAAGGLLAGCSSQSTEGETLLERPIPPPREDLDTAPRPPAEAPPDARDDTVDPRQYPSKPTEYDEATLENFVESHEKAYRRNAVLDRWGGDVVQMSFNRFWTATLATKDGAGVGKCEYKYSYLEDDGEGPKVASDSTFWEVSYYVDDSTIVRAEATSHDERTTDLSPDLWKTGVVLESTD